jgi:hypothetical protein
LGKFTTFTAPSISPLSLARERQAVCFVRLAVFTCLFVAFAAGTGGAALANDLYRAKVIVTGQREETRGPGIEKALADVVVKASGDPTLTSMPAYSEISKRAGSFVATYKYRDRMEGLPVGDEQGTRDRPYDLTVDFDPAAIKQIVERLGSKVWEGPRARIVVFLAVQNDDRRYVLTADREQGRTQREAFADASWKYAMPVVLPESSLLKASNIDFAQVADSGPKAFNSLAEQAGGDVPLVGTLIWSPKDLGWVAEWRLDHGDETHRWEIRGVNFDAAFRSAVSGAMAILSKGAEK